MSPSSPRRREPASRRKARTTERRNQRSDLGARVLAAVPLIALAAAGSMSWPKRTHPARLPTRSINRIASWLFPVSEAPVNAVQIDWPKNPTS